SVRVTVSSEVAPARVYVPGKSTNCTGRPSSANRSSNRSTVVPGQLPTRRSAPDIELIRVDLPVLGLPTMTRRKGVCWVCVEAWDLSTAAITGLLDANEVGLGLPNRQMEPGHGNLQRIAQRGAAHQTHDHSGRQPQRHQTPHKGRRPSNLEDFRLFAWGQLM